MENSQNKESFGLIYKNKLAMTLGLITFLLSIFMGAIDNSIVSPARTLIQGSFGITENVGIWMITLYSLIYAVSMPLVSKLSDRYGRKQVFLISIITFGFGSFLVGLTNIFTTLNHFEFFLIGRTIQAIGGGGIIPIATAEISLSFPVEKRGSALGLVGAVYGIANILGPTLGSAILDIAGQQNWGWLFFINIPITIIAVILSNVIPKSNDSTNKAFDLLGSVILAIVVASLLYAFTNLNFFDFKNTLLSNKVYPFLIIFLLFIPILVLVEKRSQDPVLNLNYFKDIRILKVLILSFVVGAGFISIIFIPQFAENTLMLKSGSGGYLVTILSLFSGIAAPLSGKLIDKFGAKIILAIGFIFNILGYLDLAYVAPHFMNFPSIILGFFFIGLGLGFTVGVPLNYLMLQNIKKEESATGLATVALLRSVGVTLSPGIMIGFIANAGKNILPNLQKALPDFTMIPSSGSDSTTTMSSMFQNTDITNIVNKIVDSVEKSNIPQIAKRSAITSIEDKASIIKDVFQKTLNDGFTSMFIVVASISLIGIILLIAFGKDKKI